MNLPNPQQVKNIVGHLGTAAGTVIVLLGLQAKGVDPVKVTAAITALGDLVNTLMIVIGAVGGVWAGYDAWRGSSTPAVILQSSQAISADPKAVAASLSPETKVALAEATVDMAANSKTTNETLLQNVVVKLDNVQGIVTDKSTAESTPHPFITADPKEIPKAA